MKEITLTLDAFTIARLGQDQLYAMAEEQLDGIDIKEMRFMPSQIDGEEVIYRAIPLEWDFKPEIYEEAESTFDYFIDDIEPNSNLDKDWVYRALGYEAAEVASFTIEKENLFKVGVSFCIQGDTKAVADDNNKEAQIIADDINKSELPIEVASKAIELIKNGDIELVDSCWIESFVDVELFGKKVIENLPTDEVYDSVHECGSIDAVEMAKWAVKVAKDKI